MASLFSLLFSAILIVPGAIIVAAPAEVAREPDRPFFAVWRDSDGREMSACLRIAIWDDGRVLFDGAAPKWSRKLRTGRLAQERVERLKRALDATGVFQLTETTHLVPDGPMICLMVRIGNREQVLSWDEVESPITGIDVSPSEAKLQFKRCWGKLNQLALEARPPESKPAETPFRSPPQSWYGKR